MELSVPAAASYNPKTRGLSWAHQDSAVLVRLPNTGRISLSGRHIYFRTTHGNHIMTLSFPNVARAEKLMARLLAPHVRDSVAV